MNTVRAAAVRVMPPANEIAIFSILYRFNEVAV